MMQKAKSVLTSQKFVTGFMYTIQPVRTTKYIRPGSFEDMKIKDYENTKRLTGAPAHQHCLDRKPKVNRSFMFFDHSAPTTYGFRVGNIKNWLRHMKTQTEIDSQQFVPERHKTLGCDLAAAHFILYRGGKIKFFHRPEWLVLKNIKDKLDIPNQYDPEYAVTGIDATGMNLYYEGLENLENLNRLEWLSLRDNSTIDDWCLDKISTMLPRLKYLDISNCEKITERGIEAFCRTFSLEKLIVTNFNNSAAFELTCFLLEDVNPKLKVDILEPKGK